MLTLLTKLSQSPTEHIISVHINNLNTFLEKSGTTFQQQWNDYHNTGWCLSSVQIHIENLLCTYTKEEIENTLVLFQKVG